MWKKKNSNTVSAFNLCIILIYFAVCIIHVTAAAAAAASFDDEDNKIKVLLAKENEWRSVVSTEYGEISDVEISDGINGTYYLQLITMDPNALFLPVVLHADMIFYVHSGSGRVTWFSGDGETNGNKHRDKDRSQGVRIQRGDVYRLKSGTIFYMQSSLDNERRKLRIYAIFANSVGDLREPVIGPYSGVRDLVLGFDKKVLQAAFQMPEETVEEITSAKKPPQIVHATQNLSSRTFWEVEAQFIEAFLGRNMYNMFDVNKKEKSTGVYNFFTGDRDVENCNGWSTAVSSKQSPSLRGSNIGLFMVNLTKGAMMGPHWNPTATEIAIVLEGQGMVNVVCLSSGRKECNNTRFMVKEGDAFVVPRYHPMAQMAFNNGTFVFLGFTTRDKNNHPQFLAGKRSVLQTLQKQVLAVAFNVSNSTVSRLLEPQNDSIILECVSCAEEEIEKQREEEARAREEERKRQEEERKRQEEEKRKREEEEAKKREEEKKKREEEEMKRKEEEEARKREEEKRRQEEEARKREESRKREEEMERRRQEEAARKKEEARKRQEEEKRKREEEEAKKREEEEEMKRKEEEEARKREEEKKREEEEARKREEEEAAERKREEEMERKREEEEATQARRAAEARKREEEEKEKRREEEAARCAEEAKKREEEKARRKKKEQAQQEEAKKREKEKAKKEEERRQEEQVQKEETRRQQEAAKEAETARKAKEDEQARQRKEREETRKREAEKAREEEDRRQGEEQAQRVEQKRQEAAARRAKEEEARQREEQEEAGRTGKKKSQEEEQERKRQEETKYQPGGPGGEGRRVLRKMWPGELEE